MIIAFLYSAEVSQNEGGCNECIGVYEDEHVAILFAEDMAKEKYTNSLLLYLDLFYTKDHPHVIRYRKRGDERGFYFSHQYPVSHNTQRNSDGGDACPY